MVGFQGCFFFGDFAKVDCVAVRVDENMRGLGLGAKLSQACMEKIMEVNPGVSIFFRFVTIYSVKNVRIIFRSLS